MNEKEKLMKTMKRLENLNQLFMALSCLALMMIFLGILVSIWYGLIGIKFVLSTILIFGFSELWRKSINQVRLDCAKKLYELL